MATQSSARLLLFDSTLLPLAHIWAAGVPGPFAAKITGLWRTWRYFRLSWHDDIISLHDTYGPVVRIAPGEVSVVDADAVKRMYSHGSNTKKTAWYDTWSNGVTVPILFSETDKKIHAALRRRVSSAYSMTNVLKYELYMQECFDLCMKKFRKYADGRTAIDMSEWTHALAFDIVGELCFGKKLGHLEAEVDVGGLRSANTADIYWAGNFGHLWFQTSLYLNPYMDAILKLFRLNNAGMDEFYAWNFGQIMARKEGRGDPQREDMLTHFLRMKPMPGNKELDDMEVFVEAVNVIGAGADTTAIGMRSCLYYVCTHPDVYKRLQQDIDDYHTQNQLDGPTTYTQAQKLPYLRAVVAEATRLLPSIVYQLLREAPEEGITVNDCFIPPGTSIGISPLAQNRDKGIWGKDANEFRPERWIEDPSKTAFYESYNMTFGGNGPRACVGKNLALVEMYKFLSQLLRDFDVEIVNTAKPWNIKTYWFMDQTEFFVRLHTRTVT
ncbi:hypothetical protein G7Z17_g278 [Cylindrodendrum hubeiense]|uniref:Cytochrome P450 monooxygenase n=1 Tax=Cylindrodendrum hubeiense TaxID=595255 RepID=A0A9P5LN93_9HYPO|nr:hypothetical protein G7Z17_g278 [Cylindrodendrum hubeiense]